MTTSRRKFLAGLGAAAGGLALSPLIKTRSALGGTGFNTNRIVIVGIGGGLRNREALGMAEGATMPNLFGRIPLIPGFGSTDAGDPVIAPEYEALPQIQSLVLPTPRATPLFEDGTLITNLRYAEGAPGHLQGHGCLVSGFYNNIENRADARLPVPTIFEIHRRAANTPSSDAWYISNVGGFYSALQASDNPAYGTRYGGRFLSPPNAMSIFLPFIASGKRSYDLSTDMLPSIPDDEAERAAVGRMLKVLDGNTPSVTDAAAFRATAVENADLERHLGRIFSDPFNEIYPGATVGIGLGDPGNPDSTSDALTIYHAERILDEFKPSVMALSLIDVDVCHSDFNGYLRNQQLADALVTHLWDFIESTPGLAGETTMIVLPEHGRHLFFNGVNTDSLGRSGIDHGQGDDGDRDVWMLVLGPDTPARATPVEPTGISQSGRAGDTYETIDAVMTAMALLGHDEDMTTELTDAGARPGLIIDEVVS